MAVEVEYQRAIVQGADQIASRAVGNRGFIRAVYLDRSKSKRLAIASGKRIAGIGKDIFGVVIRQVDHAISPCLSGTRKVIADNLIDNLFGLPT